MKIPSGLLLYVCEGIWPGYWLTKLEACNPTMQRTAHASFASALSRLGWTCQTGHDRHALGVQRVAGAITSDAITGKLPELDMDMVMYSILGAAVGLKVVLYLYCVALKGRSDSMLALAEVRRLQTPLYPFLCLCA